MIKKEKEAKTYVGKKGVKYFIKFGYHDGPILESWKDGCCNVLLPRTKTIYEENAIYRYTIENGLKEYKQA